MIHFDAHSDTNDTCFGDNPYTHGTPFRRAVEEGLLDPKHVVQIGIRGSISHPDDHGWARDHGMKIIYMEEFVRRGVDEVMREAEAVVGDQPTFVSFDIDCIDPSMAPEPAHLESAASPPAKCKPCSDCSKVSISSGPMSSRSRRPSTSAE